MSEGPYNIDNGYIYGPGLLNSGIMAGVSPQSQALRMNHAYAAGLAAGRAASPTPPPTGGRPWERLDVECYGGGGYRVVSGQVWVANGLTEHQCRALADAYNAARPTPDAEAIAREAAERIEKELPCHYYPDDRAGQKYYCADDATRIIADAIRKGRGE